MSYKPATTAYEHQSRALSLLRKHDYFAVLMEMGTGKSKVICDEWGERADDGEIPNLLVIAPAGSYRNWWDPTFGEIALHMPEEFRKDALVVPWKSGGNTAWKQSLANLLKTKGRPRVFVVNIEALSTVVEAREACKQFLQSAPTLMVIDESTTIRHHSSMRTKVINGYFDKKRNKWINGLRDFAALRRILTGLVSPNSPLDVYSQYYFLHPNIIGQNSYWGFQGRYAVVKNLKIPIYNQVTRTYVDRIIPQVVDFKFQDELQSRLAPYSYRVLKKDCLDLPEQTYVKREIAMTKEQESIYNDIRDTAMAELESMDFVTATHAITRILRCHQVACGFVVDENKKVHSIKENRTAALLEVLDEAEGKVIIWTCYRAYLIPHLVETIKKAFGPESIAEFHGGNKGDRVEQEHRWKLNDNCRFMIATTSAGSRGNNWQDASTAVYYANSWDLEYRLQSEDRIHRIGSKWPITYVDLATPNTVDDKIIKALREKLNLATDLMGDGYRKWLV